jgi:hypothetical protein
MAKACFFIFLFIVTDYYLLLLLFYLCANLHKIIELHGSCFEKVVAYYENIKAASALFRGGLLLITRK